MPTLAEIAVVVGGDVEGDDSLDITHVCDLKDGTVGGIAYLADPKYIAFLADCQASAVIVDKSTDAMGLPVIRTGHPKVAFSKAVALLHPADIPKPGIHSTAVVSETAVLGDNLHIGPFAVIGDYTTIGDNCIIGARVSLGSNVTIGQGTRFHTGVVIYDNVEIGESTVIHAATVIGIDGFGYVPGEDPPVKIPHVGKVIIGKGVEIGSNTCIDRGTIGNTTVGDGTKIDNLVQIAHNVQIGKGCLLSGETGLAGSVTLGDNVILAAQVGVADHITIGDGAIVAGKAGVRQSLEGGKVYAGDPAIEHPTWMRKVIIEKKLPEIFKRLKALEQGAQ